ncbi:ABC-F family ATP-binding cassette domain-containing protein [Caulobacter sp. NIBR1757]|uniref:ABC-F family ATP-binding cassette domain-containing protein n=1 Tax=Caulobacter sp. NIBR1757 TaxID=3016000 RepID=UPI0022F10CE1|nr:ABC-F family ATP-binding cassette domain-containing protein [Caulobacter sp. NIBR1757]WGM41156.1 putative ABC transporter ATP-binding protein YbiT [Caulobacter sp. NIBR1757]
MAPRQAVLGMDGASFFHGSTRIFEDVSFLLDDARTALVGENGAGKTTLLRCLAGELELDKGQVLKSRSLRVGYLPQDIPPGLDELPVREVLRRSLEKVGNGDDDWRIDVLLDEIEVAPEVAEQAFGSLSGGWRRLLLIAGAAVLEEPDILILDEPTNHLDLSNINRLEDWLTAAFEAPMLIVSHDREFLNRVTDRTLFLRADGVHSFKSRFDLAREELLRRDAAAARQRKLEEKEVRRLEAAAARYKVWAVKNPELNKRKKAIESRIARIENDRTEVVGTRDRRLELAEGEIDAKVALRVQGLTVTTPDKARTLISIDRLAIAAGDRVAILGTNGAGKTTLLNALAAAFDPAREHYDGTAAVRFNPAARLVYFDQSMKDLPLKTSLLNYVTAAPDATEREATRLLAQAGFPYLRINDPISRLSYGERARLIFLRLKLERPNFYLLDEPTNHLDIEGQEALEAELESAEVSCLFVSHDRYFTRTAANRFLEIRRGKLVEVEDPDAFFDAQGR